MNMIKIDNDRVDLTVVENGDSIIISIEDEHVLAGIGLNLNHINILRDYFNYIMERSDKK